MRTRKKSQKTIFKMLQHETTVYEYFVELKEDALTKRGFLDLVKVPNLCLTDAGQFLKQFRKKNNLRQKDLTDAFNYSHAKVSQWETNQFNMKLHDLIEIVEAFGSPKDSKEQIYLLIDQGKINTLNHLPARFEKIRHIVQYFHPEKGCNEDSVDLFKSCSDEILSEIKKTLNVNPKLNSYNAYTIYSRELNRYLKTFFRYTKVPKINPPLTTEVRDWYDNGIDLKRAIILPSLQSDGGIMRNNSSYSLCFTGYNKVLHDYFIDAMHYEYNELPSTYYVRNCVTEYKIELDDIFTLAGNTKTKPANKQTVKDYLREPQPHLDYLITAPKAEQKIALRIWAATEGCITTHREEGRIYPRLEIACAHPDLATQLRQIARHFNINFTKIKNKNYWSGVKGLYTKAISSCMNFLKLGGFIKGVKISSHSKFYEGIDKDILLLGILEYKKRESENKYLRNLSPQEVHQKINRIVKNNEYRSAEYYINYFS